jgi:hypothetical protein
MSITYFFSCCSSSSFFLNGGTNFLLPPTELFDVLFPILLDEEAAPAEEFPNFWFVSFSYIDIISDSDK